MVMTIVRVTLVLGGTAAYLGLAILGWGGWSAFFAHPARVALAVVLAGIVKLLGMLWSPGNSRHIPDAIATDPTLRQPALCPLFRPNSRSGFSSLGGTRRQTTDAVVGGSVGQ